MPIAPTIPPPITPSEWPVPSAPTYSDWTPPDDRPADDDHGQKPSRAYVASPSSVASTSIRPVRVERAV